MTSLPELVSQIDDRSAALRDAVAAAPDLRAAVPGCPGWSLTDLVLHLGDVQRWWAVVVGAGAAGDPPPFATRDTTPSGDELVPWSADGTRLLLAALGEAGPDAPCWTWWGASGAAQDSGAVARHQVQEAAVHAWDAQRTIGTPDPVPAGVAVDALDEFIAVSMGSSGPWPHRPARYVFAATEGPSFTVDLEPGGARPAPAASGAPVATLHGSASDLLLAVYGRVPLDTLTVDGDRTAVAELLAWVGTD